MNYPLTLDMDSITYNIDDLVSRAMCLPIARVLLGILNILCQGRGGQLGNLATRIIEHGQTHSCLHFLDFYCLPYLLPLIDAKGRWETWNQVLHPLLYDWVHSSASSFLNREASLCLLGLEWQEGFFFCLFVCLVFLRYGFPLFVCFWKQCLTVQFKLSLNLRPSYLHFPLASRALFVMI